MTDDRRAKSSLRRVNRQSTHSTHHTTTQKSMNKEGKALLHLYRRLLRSCATYPSKNRWGMYASIREEFRVRILS